MMPKLYTPYCKSTAKYNYFNHRVRRIWNVLPCDEVDFSSLRRFRNSLTAKVLVRYCSLNFILVRHSSYSSLCVTVFYHHRHHHRLFQTQGP